jgi:hypothetical protein
MKLKNDNKPEETKSFFSRPYVTSAVFGQPARQEGCIKN